MKLDFTDFLYALSYALDAAERETTGAETGHGKRVAYISYLCAKGLGMSDQELVNLIGCAILHDNAIAEYLREERDAESQLTENRYAEIKNRWGSKSVHIYVGARNIRKLPFEGDVSDIILWHHEEADGSGPFGLTEKETCISSQIIHLADRLDLLYSLPKLSKEGFRELRSYVEWNVGKQFSHKAVACFLRNVSFQEIEKMQKEGAEKLLREHIPAFIKEYTEKQICDISSFFADIVDYKSAFTRNHSIGVMDKARRMAEYYGFPEEKQLRFAFAGALHDIGKMVVGNDILEKPDRLNVHEFDRMKDHASETYRILHSIHGLEDVAEWAANHHEKLDGTGYARGLSGVQLPFEDRLMACIDIYQALTEARPYKDGLSHRKTMRLMKRMARDGKIDPRITEDMDLVFGAGQTEEQDEEEARFIRKRWKCEVCGYIYEGDTPPRTCPVCSSDMDRFFLVQ